MAAASDKTSNTEQLQQFINNLWQHQQKNEFCDFTLTTNNNSIRCHKLILSSASSYFSQILRDREHNKNIIDVTPLPENILKTVVAFMYNSEYAIDDENVVELVKLSRTWNLDILAKLCVTYMSDNITINNACGFYNFALEDDDQHLSKILSMFIREHFTSLHESGQLRELSLKNFTTIIEHDLINVKNEDVIFNSAAQIINQQTSAEDIDRCLELIRFPHMSADFLVNVIFNHPLMREPQRNHYPKEALLYQINKTSTVEVQPPRHWQGTIYYIGAKYCMYQFECKVGNNEIMKVMDIPEWVTLNCTVAFDGHRMAFVSGATDAGRKHAMIVDMTCDIKVTKRPDLIVPELDVHTLPPELPAPLPNLPGSYVHDYLPDLPEPLMDTGVVLLHDGLYVIGGCDDLLFHSNSVYYLSLGNHTWHSKMPMPHAVTSPLVIQHKRSIYVLGGYDDDDQMLSKVAQYNIEDDTWKECEDMPEVSDSAGSGVVVHKNKIKVITVDKCMMYDDDTDTWAVQHYDALGDKVNAFIKRGQIWAVVYSYGSEYDSADDDDGDSGQSSISSDDDSESISTNDEYDSVHSLMTYDDVENVWKYELDVVAWHTVLFC